MKSLVIVANVFQGKEIKRAGAGRVGLGKGTGEKLPSSQVLRQLSQLSGRKAEQSRARFGREASLFVTMRASRGSVLSHTAQP